MSGNDAGGEQVKSLRKPTIVTTAPSLPASQPAPLLSSSPTPAAVNAKHSAAPLRAMQSDELPTKATQEVKKKSLAELLAAKDNNDNNNTTAQPIPCSASLVVSALPTTRASTPTPPLSSSAVKVSIKPLKPTETSSTPTSPEASTKRPGRAALLTVTHEATLSGEDNKLISSRTSAPSTAPSPVPLATAGEHKSNAKKQESAAEAPLRVDPKDLQSQPHATLFSFAPQDQIKAENDPKTRLAQGVAGAVRFRLRKEMLDHVEEPCKVLICDVTGAQILNSNFRMNELMAHDVILVEDLAMERQPILSSPALYFLSPDNAEGVAQMLSDWGTRPKYKTPHVFWTGRASMEVLRRTAEDRVFTRKVATMKDLLLEFISGETLLFHLNHKLNFWSLFRSEAGERVVQPESEEQLLAKKLAGVFHTFASGMPVVRYQAQSPVTKAFAERLIDEAEELKAPALSTGSLHRPLLIIVDRCFDFFEPLVHHRTYQCLCDELCPLENGMYEQTYQGRKGEELKRVMLIDERDEYWCGYRHESFDRCLRTFELELKQLLAANPSLAHGIHKGAGLAVAGDVMRALPEFLEQQSKLSTHVDICTKITQQYAKLHLQAVIELELDLLLHRTSVKDVLKRLKTLGGDLSIPTEVRVRLLTLAFAFLSEKDFAHDARLQMLANCGIGESALPVMEAIRLALPRVVKEQFQLLKKHRVETPAPLPKSGTSTPTSTISPRIPSTPSKEAASDAKAGPGLATYPSYARHILEAAMQDTLSKTEFPLLNEDAASNGMGSVLIRMNHGEKGRSLRASAARRTAVSAEKAEGFLDLGHEGRFMLKAPRKIILFVLGGITYGEARVAYELAKERGQEVMVGGCHLLQSKVWVQDLMSTGGGDPNRPATEEVHVRELHEKSENDSDSDGKV